MSQPNRKFTASDLIPGQTYRVTRAFDDYDGMRHPVGEQWRFLKKGFLPAEDGLTLIVEKDGQEVWIRLQWREESQAEIIDNFAGFVTES